MNTSKGATETQPTSLVMGVPTFIDQVPFGRTWATLITVTNLKTNPKPNLPTVTVTTRVQAINDYSSGTRRSHTHIGTHTRRTEPPGDHHHCDPSWHLAHDQQNPAAGRATPNPNHNPKLKPNPPTKPNHTRATHKNSPAEPKTNPHNKPTVPVRTHWHPKGQQKPNQYHCIGRGGTNIFID